MNCVLGDDNLFFFLRGEQYCKQSFNDEKKKLKKKNVLTPFPEL